ncbi:hypothetical protein FJT64_013566 [Amphibalanus amphitrite]|uniref:Retrotransposon gag domain-containing protein n=1 Tax=Amphibalanus amphitrite TaxID=1232801 RepID=A0A6A4VC92_AMPAM|nr:hypothetical protein FJT64_013566 [Amphibalanus amphitrite]
MNVEGVSPPTPFLARPGKPALPWSDWIFSFHNYLTALGGEAYSTERKTALLLHCVGAEAQRVYRTLPVQPRREDEDEFHAAERQLAEFYEPQVNVIAERFFFRQRRQESHEPTADYVAALRRLAVNCSFGQMTDAMIRDQVVEATVHPILRERFLQDKGLTLDRVLEIAEAFERSRREATAMAGPARPAADGAQMPVPAEEANLHEDSSAEEEVIALLTDEESVLTEQDVRTASAADPELQQLRHQIKRGWPSSAKACPVEVQPYFKMRHELWVRNDDVTLRPGQRPGNWQAWFEDFIMYARLYHQNFSSVQLRPAGPLSQWNGSGINVLGKMTVTVRGSDSGEVLADIYVAVGQLPLMGRDLQQQLALTVRPRQRGLSGRAPGR